MAEPPVCEEDQDKLFAAYMSLCRAGKINRRSDEFLPKSEVKKVIIAAGLKTSKYLEKYLTIGFMLTGVMPYRTPPSDELIECMTEDFKIMINLFYLNNRFGRHAMINYNLIIRESLKRHGGDEYVHLFPELKTKTKLNKAMEIYDSIWIQHIEGQIISSIGEYIREKKRENAKLDTQHIAPRITTRSHLKRKYVALGSPDTKKDRKLPRRKAD